MKKTLLLIFLFIPISLNMYKIKGKVLHPVHISFTTIEYFEKEKEYKVLFKIFVDDFDLILNSTYKTNLNLTAGRWEKAYIKTINSYIQNNFKITDNDNKNIKLKFDNQEFKEQSIFLYYKAKHKTNVGKFRVLNKIMLDLYPDQKNLLIFVFDGKTQALQFKQNEITKEINF